VLEKASPTPHHATSLGLKESNGGERGRRAGGGGEMRGKNRGSLC
jgi:hypothetical protein